MKSIHKDPPFIFAARICLALTISACFTLISSPTESTNGWTWPESGWIYITSCVVTWMPSVDAASTVKKSIERILGTILGASIGVGIGFLSLLFGQGTSGQAAFLGVILAVFLFAWPYYCHKKKTTGYMQVLTIATIGLISLAFYSLQDNPWWEGVWRAANVIIGCVISALVCIFVFPISLDKMLQDQFDLSMKHVGKAIRLLLEVAANDQPHKLKLLGEFILDGTGQQDEIHEAYFQSMSLIFASKEKQPLIKYELWLWCAYDLDQQKLLVDYYRSVQLQRARLSRFVMSIFNLDSLVRHGIQSMNLSRVEGLSSLLQDTGTRLESLLNMNWKDQASIEERNQLVHLLLKENLAQLEDVRLNKLGFLGQEWARDDISLEQIEQRMKNNTEALLLDFHSERSSISYFLLNLEYVIIRAAKLHFCYAQTEKKLVKSNVRTAEKNDEEVTDSNAQRNMKSIDNNL